jgi:Transposase DDE domain group 1
LRVNADNDVTSAGRLVIRADDPNLTPYAGLAIVGALARRTRLVELIDAQLGVVRTARPVKRRRRGLSPGALVVSLAECQIAGADCFDDVEDVRGDGAGAALRAVADTPSAPTARQLAKRFRRSHIRAIERAQARVGERLDGEAGRDGGEDVTFDLDATDTEVYGHAKQGAARGHGGGLGYCSYVVTWAQRGRALTSELVGANRARISAKESAAMIARAVKLLPAEHGQVTARVDSGFYSAELMMSLRKQRARFSMSAPRTATMWRALAEIPEDAWADATMMRGAQVAETAFTPTGFVHEPLRLIVRRVTVSAAELRAGNPRARRRTTIPADQLQMVLDGRLDSTFAYSLIVTDIPTADKDTVAVEHFHRQRAQIEERFKDAKLGQPLRHLPSGNLDANRLWLACCLLALNITALICDISPAAAACPDAPDHTPLRRHAKALRRILFNVPARITRSARQTIVHLSENFRYLDIFTATYHAALARPDP